MANRIADDEAVFMSILLLYLDSRVNVAKSSLILPTEIDGFK